MICIIAAIARNRVIGADNKLVWHLSADLRRFKRLTMGHTLAQCLSLMWLINRACEVQLATLSMGKPRAIAQPVLESCVRDSLNFDPKYGAGQDAFDALQRIVDRIDPTYRS